MCACVRVSSGRLGSIERSRTIWPSSCCTYATREQHGGKTVVRAPAVGEEQRETERACFLEDRDRGARAVIIKTSPAILIVVRQKESSRRWSGPGCSAADLLPRRAALEQHPPSFCRPVVRRSWRPRGSSVRAASNKDCRVLRLRSRDSPCPHASRSTGAKEQNPRPGPASLRLPPAQSMPAPLGALPPLLLLLLLTVASRCHPHRGRQAYRCLAA